MSLQFFKRGLFVLLTVLLPAGSSAIEILKKEPKAMMEVKSVRQQVKALTAYKPMPKGLTSETQWTPIDSIQAGEIQFIRKIQEHNLTYLGTREGRLYSIDSDGVTKIVPVGETADVTSGISGFNDMTVFKSDVYLATLKGLYRSKDGMQTWEKVHSLDIGSSPVRTVFSDQDAALLVSTDSGSYRSEDGLIWHPMTDAAFPTYFVSNGSTLLARAHNSDYDIVISNDHGKQWQNVRVTQSGGIYTKSAKPVTASNGKFYAGVLKPVDKAGVNTQNYLMESVNGSDWDLVKTPIDEVAKGSGLYIDRVVVDANGVIYASDTGFLGALKIYNIYAKFPNQDKWQTIYEDVFPVSTLNIVDGQLSIALEPIGEYKTYDSNAKQWSPSGWLNSARAVSISYTDGSVYMLVSAASQQDVTDVFSRATGFTSYRGYLHGNWVRIKFPGHPLSTRLIDIYGSGDFIAAINDEGIVQYTKDNGFKFDEIKQYIPGAFQEAAAIIVFNSYVYASTGSGIFRSSDYTKWEQVYPEFKDYAIVRKMFDANDQLYAPAQEDGVLISKDGVTWSSYNEGLDPNATDIRAVASENGVVVAGGKGLYVRKEGAPKWMPVFNNLESYIGSATIIGVALHGEYVAFTASQCGIYLGFINGTGLEDRTGNLPSRNVSFCAWEQDGNFVLGTMDVGVFNTTLP